MLKSICTRCGAPIPYRTTCTCHKASKRTYDKQYDTQQRDATSTAIYHSKAWATVRAAAIARDNGLCLLCLSNQRIKTCGTVHHIVEAREDSSTAYDVGNLISLCFKCHFKVHKAYEADKQAEQSKLRGLLT